jgi:hypothetical protein
MPNARKTKPNKKRKPAVVADREFKHYGRPTIYSEELANRLCAELAKGTPLSKICEDEGMPASATVFRWLTDSNKPEFREKYAYAREAQATKLADDILKIADDGRNDTQEDDNGNKITNHDVINRSRLRVDARKWLASKIFPKTFGDKVSAEISGPDGGPAQVQIILPSNGREKQNDAAVSS